MGIIVLIKEVKKQMIKKGLTILIAAIVITGLICVIGSAAADMNIETELRASGNGSFSRDMEVQMKYASSLGVYMGNSTEFENETVSEITYAQTAASTNAKQRVCSSNYDIAASQGFSTEGHTGKSFETVMDDHVSEFEIEGKVSG
jgi:hypothetical protein